MKQVVAVENGAGLTKGRVYDVLYEDETSYQIKADNGSVKRGSKDFFIPLVKDFTYLELFERYKELESTIRFLSSIVQNPINPIKEDLDKFAEMSDGALNELSSLKEDVLNHYKRG